MTASKLEPFLFDQVPQPDDPTAIQLSQEQLQGYMARLLACLLETEQRMSSRFQLPFYGEDLSVGATSVELMEENTEIGIPIARAVSTGRVAVKFKRATGAAPGNWTLRLFKNGVEVATFAVPTT